MSLRTSPGERTSGETGSDCDRAVEYLWSVTGAPRERVRELLLAEIERLGGSAAITKYVHVLAASNIRAMLRRDIAAPDISRPK